MLYTQLRKITLSHLIKYLTNHDGLCKAAQVCLFWIMTITKSRNLEKRKIAQFSQASTQAKDEAMPGPKICMHCVCVCLEFEHLPFHLLLDHCKGTSNNLYICMYILYFSTTSVSIPRDCWASIPNEKAHFKCQRNNKVCRYRLGYHYSICSAFIT